MEWTHLMIHCSDTPPVFDVKRREIEKWHLNERGWSRVGYSMLIERGGKLDILIPFDNDDIIESWEISNGAAGWNGRTKHICWVGGRSTEGATAEDNRTPGQHTTLEAVCRMLVMLYPNIQLIGHNQVNEHKYCPSFDVRKWAKDLGFSDRNIDFHKYVKNPFLT